MKICANKIIQIQQKLANIQWASNINILPSDNLYLVQKHALSYWIKYEYSMTLALLPSNFNINLIFSQQINQLWYRHVIIYVNNKPYIYAITITKSPHEFNLLKLDNKSIGTQLFKSNIIKGKFRFTRSNILLHWINKNFKQQITNIYGRQRFFKKMKYHLCLQEYFLIE